MAGRFFPSTPFLVLSAVNPETIPSLPLLFFVESDWQQIMFTNHRTVGFVSLWSFFFSPPSVYLFLSVYIFSCLFLNSKSTAGFLFLLSFLALSQDSIL